MVRHFVLIPAAGSSSRLGGGTPKQYLPIGGRAMILRTIEALLAVAGVHRICILLATGDTRWTQVSTGLPDKVIAWHCGGATRMATVRSGLEQLASEASADDWILVHDAARPCVDPKRIEAMMTLLKDDLVGGLLALPVADTIKRGSDRSVMETLPRENLWLAQTPQMFRYALLREALAPPSQDHATDEAQAVEAMGLKPRLIPSDPSNLKVTYAADLALAEAILAGRAGRRVRE